LLIIVFFSSFADPSESIVQDVDAKRTQQSYTKRAGMIDESIGKSHDWKSPIFSIVGSKSSHPAHTGKPIGGTASQVAHGVSNAAHGAHGAHGTQGARY
jgi:hypothetical protein